MGCIQHTFYFRRCLLETVKRIGVFSLAMIITVVGNRDDPVFLLRARYIQRQGSQ